MVSADRGGRGPEPSAQTDRAAGEAERLRAEVAAMVGRSIAVLDHALALAERAAASADDAVPAAGLVKALMDGASLAVRTLEKSHDLLRTLASEAEASGTGEVTPQEHADLVARVERWIEGRVEERVARRLAGRDRERPDEPSGPDGEGVRQD